jgi:hypothetical protein
VSPKLAPSAQIADPIQGWDEWGSKFVEKIDACQSLAEIDVLRQSQSCLLRASSNRSVQVYQSICTALRDRQGALGSNKPL